MHLRCRKTADRKRTRTASPALQLRFLPPLRSLLSRRRLPPRAHPPCPDPARIQPRNPELDPALRRSAPRTATPQSRLQCRRRPPTCRVLQLLPAASRIPPRPPPQPPGHPPRRKPAAGMTTGDRAIPDTAGNPTNRGAPGNPTSREPTDGTVEPVKLAARECPAVIPAAAPGTDTVGIPASSPITRARSSPKAAWPRATPKRSAAAWRK